MQSLPLRSKTFRYLITITANSNSPPIDKTIYNISMGSDIVSMPQTERFDLSIAETDWDCPLCKIFSMSFDMF